MTSNLKDQIRQVYLRLSGKDLSEEAAQGPIQMDGQVLRDLFLKLESDCVKEDKGKDEQLSELRLQLVEVKHNYSTLQSEYESKFERNQVVTLNIPQQKKGLDVTEEEHDSIKSFRPESDDDSDDVRRREEELKAMKRQEQMHAGHKHTPGHKCCHNHSHNHLYMDTHQQHYGL